MSELPGQDDLAWDSSVAEVYGRLSVGLFALDEDLRVTYRNESAARVFDADETAVLGEVVWEAFPGSVRSTFEPAFTRAMETGEAVTFEAYSAPLDEWYELEACPSETGISVLLREVTDRVERETELRHRERALRRSYDVISDPERSFDEQLDDLLEVVRRAVGTEYATLSRVRGDEYTFEAIAAPDGADLQPGDTVPLESTNCDRVVSTERTLVLDDVERDAPELADRAGNAEWGISCYLGAPVFVEDDVYGTFCFYGMETRSEAFSDWEVTFVDFLSNWVSSQLTRRERARQREELIDRLEESNRRLDQFAYAASHDLQEPLRMVTSYLRLIEGRYADQLDEDGAEFIDFAVDGADRMRDMIESLLEYARIETAGNPMGPVDLNEILASVRTDLQVSIRETGADISVGDLPRVEGDADQLRQLFQNLLGNAIEYSGGESPRVRVSAERADGDWVISVGDDGIGIEPEEQERIFEVFERLHGQQEHSGTGIGLALCRRIVERHGGEIRVESTPGDGSTFSVAFPRPTAE